MKKILLLLALFLILTGSLFALDGAFVGLGAELNACSREGVAAGGVLSFGLDINQLFAAGVKTAFSHNMDTVAVLEPAAFFRFYLPLSFRGPFVQGEAGAAVFFEDGETFPVFSGGLAVGWRIPLGKNWYVEPAARGGYPYMWAVSVTAGFKWDINK